MRGYFNELITYPDFIKDLISKLEKQGAFTTGIETFNRRGTRGASINTDVYGYDESLQLAAIQVRQCVWRKNRYSQVRKNYFLCGYNENGNVFSHPVNSPSRSKSALQSPESCIRWLECSIFNCTEKQFSKAVRQGDIAFIPSAVPSQAELFPTRTLTVDGEGSHLLKTEGFPFIYGNELYVKGRATLTHLKNQHKSVEVKKGSWRVVCGYRSFTYDFSAATRD